MSSSSTKHFSGVGCTVLLHGLSMRCLAANKLLNSAQATGLNRTEMHRTNHCSHRTQHTCLSG